MSNLAALCRSHHLLKHYGNWTVTHGPDGTMTWTSPTGRHMADRPAPVVRFLSSEKPPPGPPPQGDIPPF